MGFLQKLLGREQPPAQKTHRRHMQGANLGRLEQSWGATPTTIDAEIYKDWSTLVARSREQCNNNDHAKKFLQMVETNVVGPNGFTLKSQVKDPNGNLDLVAQTAIETAWYEFSEIGNFDVTGTMSRADVEKLIIRSAAKDGEAIAVKQYGPEFPHGFALQMIDPVMMDPAHFEKLGSGNYVRHGIEFTPSGKPVAYWFSEWEEHQMGYVTGARPRRRVLAENVIHVFLPEVVGQKRGLPWMRTALWRMKMLQGYEDATLTKKRQEAAVNGFFRDPEGESLDSEELPQEVGEPGTFFDIGNREFVQPPMSNSSGDFEPFVRSALRSIASGLGVNYNSLANDLTSVNFSSIRQGALDEREMWKGLQEWFIGQWCKKVFAAWLPAALVNQKITVPNRGGVLRPLPFEKLDKYKPSTFRGRRWAWIDPNAEMKATELAMNLNITSRTQAIEDMGGDAEDVFAAINREREQMKSMGLDPTLPYLLENQPTPQDEASAAA